MSSLKARQPELGGAKSDTASTIISVLEMSEEDFTTLLAEAEATEDEAAKAYKSLTDENKVSKVSKELDAVLAYLDKLKPECESKAMSYEEKKAAREAEIEGLKEALSILSGPALLQTSHKVRRVKLHA